MTSLSRLTCAGLLAAAMVTPSFAADLPRPVYKAPYSAPVFVQPLIWQGFYIGVSGGYGWGTSSWTNPATGVTTGDFDVSGGIASGTIGYNFQFGSFVVGAEGDMGRSWIKGSTTTACGGSCETSNTWMATARGRLGYSFDRWLPFITGGAAFGGVEMNTPFGTSQTQTQTGWTAGAGVEYAFLGGWSAKAEYLYIDLGTASCDVATCTTNIDVTFKTNVVRAGLNYRF